MNPDTNPLRFTDPALYEMRRNGWLKIAESWKRYTELGALLNATFEPQVLELRARMSYEQLQAVGEVSDLVIQVHHTMGAPLVLPVLFVAAFLERMDDFYRNRTPGVHLKPHHLSRCAVTRSLGASSSPAGLMRLPPKMTFVTTRCSRSALCVAQRAALKSTSRSTATTQTDGPAPEPGEPLELYRQPTELLAGTWPAEYGVEIPEAGDAVIRKEP